MICVLLAGSALGCSTSPAHPWKFIGKDGSTIVDDLEEAKSFSEGLAAARRNGKWGYVGKSGQWQILPIFDDASSFSQGLAPVKRNKSYGYIDRNGRTVIDFKFDRAYGFNEGLAATRMAGSREWTFIDRSGKCVIDSGFDFVGYFSEGLCSVGKHNGSLWDIGFIDTQGKLVIPYRYKMAEPFKNGFAIVYTEFSAEAAPLKINTRGQVVSATAGCAICPVKVGKMWCYMKEKKMLTAAKFVSAEEFAEGLAAVQTPSFTWGFLEERGVFLVEPKFNSASSFSEGMAVVGVRTSEYDEATRMEKILFGYLNTKGEVVIPLQFSDAFSFKDDIALVRMDKAGW